MQMLEIMALKNGAHRNQTYNGYLPDGWALIPDNLETPNFPFGEVTVEDMEGRMVVATWTPLQMPEPEEPPKQEAKYNVQDDIDAMLIDQEYRLTLLELGLTKGV